MKWAAGLFFRAGHGNGRVPEDCFAVSDHVPLSHTDIGAPSDVVEGGNDAVAHGPSTKALYDRLSEPQHSLLYVISNPVATPVAATVGKSSIEAVFKAQACLLRADPSGREAAIYKQLLVAISFGQHDDGDGQKVDAHSSREKRAAAMHTATREGGELRTSAWH